ncbi:MAG: N-acetylmuramoyl-L-alanine amidase [Fibrobacter sp.]|nr:N-acetylmuramoyl-L-alanine amidase [Fibrobacter sp.]
MRPETIKKREDEFFSNLTNSSGVKYKLTATTDIGNDVKIYSIRPDFNSYYYNAKTAKKSICLHFTVGYIKSDTTSLSTKDNHVSVSYVVDRSGRIYEMFPDTEWSYHLGSGAVGGNGAMSKQSIGIEISNYGPLKLSDDKLLDAYKNEYCKVSETEFYSKHTYRGYDYYASMTDVQIDAVVALVKYLGRKHDIPMNFKSDDSPFASDADALAFKGVFYHTNVRKDKFDWPFTPSLKAIISKCTDVLPEVPESKPDATATESQPASVAPVEEKKPVETEPTPEPAPSPEPVKPAEPAPQPAPAPAPAPAPQPQAAPTQKPAQASTAKSVESKPTSLFDMIISLILQLLGLKK